MMEIFQYDFMQRAFSAGIIIGVIAPLIGLFLVVKRYSLIADTLSHVSLLGVAAGILININPILGALIISILASFGMEELRESKKIYGESVLAIFLSGSLALALILIGLARELNVNFFSYLFGSISTVSQADLSLILLFVILIIGVIFSNYRQLFLVSFDEEIAKAAGVKVKIYNLFLIILAAITVSLAMRVVGALLVGALMVIPVLSAMQFRRSFKKTLIIAIFISLAAVIIGLYLSFYIDIPSGGTIAVVTLIFFLFSFLIGQTKS
jgi:zinc transport system permease protein